MIRKIIDIVINYIESSKPLVILLILGVVIIALINGYKYFSYTRNDPHYCDLCHLMKEARISWQKSSHKDTACRTCHSMNLLTENLLLFSYVVKGPGRQPSQKHGNITPWDSCRDCHLSDVAQGAITMRKSYGHARHVFMEKIDCKQCHTEKTHNFIPDEKNCMKCHSDKGVHGMGMRSFACLSCHVYSDTPAMPKKQRCIKCHQDIPQKAIMSSVDCQNCHKPHTKLQPTAIDCISNCHTNQSSIGRHDKHMDIPCSKCHRAHSWKVGKELAATLCIKCHDYKDPLSFIF